MKKLIIILLFLFPFLASATIYYIDPAGSDAANGTSTGTAWQTLSKVAAFAFVAGDQILFKRGGTWTGSILFYQRNGSAGNPIIFDAYGTGNKPIITGRTSITGWGTGGNWTNSATNLWYISVTLNSQGPCRVWLSNIEYGPATSSGAVSPTRRWYFNSGTNRLYVYATSNPSSFYSNVEAVRTVDDFLANTTLDIYQCSYVTVQNLDIRGGFGSRAELSNHIIFQNCNLGRDGRAALFILDSDFCTVAYDTVDSGDRIIDSFYNTLGTGDGVDIFNSGSGNLIHDNYFKDWGHTSLYLIGLDSTKACQNNKIYNNYFTAPDVDYNRGLSADIEGTNPNAGGNEAYYNYFENHTVGIQLNCNGFSFYYNIINGVTNSNHGGSSGDSATAFGIEIQGYGNTQPYNMFIYNNVIANCDEPGIIFVRNPGDNVPNNNRVINNIIYNTGRNSTYSSNKQNYGFYVDNINNIGKVIAENNLIYNPGVTSPIYNGHLTSNVLSHTNDRTAAQYNSDNLLSPGDTILNNIGSDPLLVNSTSDFRLQSGSPAINAGINVGLPFNGSAPDIGAYETGVPNNIIHKGKVRHSL